jgi:hypothetical protein
MPIAAAEPGVPGSRFRCSVPERSCRVRPEPGHEAGTKEQVALFRIASPGEARGFVNTMVP